MVIGYWAEEQGKRLFVNDYSGNDPQITQIDADFFVSRKGAKARRKKLMSC